MEDMYKMEEQAMKFEEKLKLLVEMGKKKKNTLEISEINDVFSDNELEAEQMDKIFEYVEAQGIDELYFEHFDHAYASMEPEVFVKEILVKKLQAQVVVVGHNYSFGSFGKGNAELLTKLGQVYGFDVIAVPHVMRNLGDTEESVVVSSTVLRRMIREGRMEDFADLAGHYYSIPGHVVEGRHVGRSLGYPTANILPREGFALPDFGVYATVTVRNGKAYRSVTNIGNNPTFAGIRHVTVETFLLDFEGALYGAAIEVYFLCKMRGECKFESVEALQTQLGKDVAKRASMEDAVLQ
jgi:riboflavin kinase/FMN adenylyltransferase